MQKKSFDGGDSASKKYKRGHGAPVVGSGGVCAWQESGFTRREDAFTFNFRKFYKFCTFNAICKDNAAVSSPQKKVHSRQL
jgi:hypothetical protein